MLEKVRFYPVSMGGGHYCKKVPHLFKKTSFFNVKKVNVRKMRFQPVSRGEHYFTNIHNPPPYIYNSILPPEILTLFPYRGVKIACIDGGGWHYRKKSSSFFYKNILLMIEKLRFQPVSMGGGATILQIYITPPPYIYIMAYYPLYFLTLFPYRGVIITYFYKYT